VTALEEFLAAESRHVPMLTVVGQPEAVSPEPPLADVIDFPTPGARDGRRR